MRVTTDTAMTFSPWWRGIKLISSSLAKVSLQVCRRDRQGIEADKRHPAYQLLLRRPNELQTAFTFRQTLTAHAISPGNGYAYISRDEFARPLELLPLDPNVTFPVREVRQGTGELKPARVWYVTDVGGETIKIRPEDVLHVKNLSRDGLMGMNTIDRAREAIGLGLASRQYQSIIFKNAGRPSCVITVPTKMPEKQKIELRDGWERMHAGVENAHRTAILDGGAQLKEVSLSAEDNELIESQKFNLVDVANWLDLHPWFLGLQGTTGYNSLEQITQGLLEFTLDPWMCNWEEECWTKLLTEEEKDGDTHLVLHDRHGLVRANVTDKAEYWRKALGGRPWAAPNEAREAFGMNRDRDPKSDRILDPLNMGDPGGQRNEPRPPSKPPAMPAEDLEPEKPPAKKKRQKALAEAIRAGIEDAARRLVKRVGVHARRLAKEPKAFLAFLESFRMEHHAAGCEMLTASLKAAAAFLEEPGQECWPPERVVARIVDELHFALSARTDVCTAAQLPGDVDKLVAELETGLPARLAVEIMGDREHEDEA